VAMPSDSLSCRLDLVVRGSGAGSSGLGFLRPLGVGWLSLWAITTACKVYQRSAKLLLSGCKAIPMNCEVEEELG
jgi:hypothetical protein